jgi:hypothetical protein
MNLPREIASAAFRALSEFATQVSELLDGETPDTDDAPDGRCPDCDGEHPSLLDAIRAARQPQAPAEPAPSTVGRTWSPVFAGKVKVGDLIAVDGVHLDSNVGGVTGLRALRVTERETREHPGMFGGTAEAVTLLLQDVDSGEPYALVLPASAPLRIAIQAPDDPGELAGFDGGECR